MIKKYLTLCITIFFTSCSSNISRLANDKTNVISEENILEHIKYLSSDELEGRYPGTKGSDLAIDYIVSHFKSSSLVPMLDDSYLQFFDFSNLKNENSQVANVVGLIDGNKNKDEFIVIGAHFDHLGYGGVHSGSLEMNSNQIHNGADDNASGVAGVIELAKQLSYNQKN